MRRVAAAARVTHGNLTLWTQIEGGWRGRGLSGSRYEVRPVVKKRSLWFGGKRSLTVHWQLSGSGIESAVYVSTGDAMDAADSHELRVERRGA